MMWDVVVVGLGGMGAAMLDACSRRGMRALGLERHACIQHDQGSSHASSRGFRQTYHNPMYRELAARSRPYWTQLTSARHGELLVRCGATISAPAGHRMIQEVRAAARALGVQCHDLDEATQSIDFPGLPSTFQTIFEPDAGWLRASECVEAMCARARRQGAQVRVNASVERIEVQPSMSGALVRLTSGETIHASRVVVCTAGDLIPVRAPHVVPEPHRESLRFRRQTEHWFDVSACVRSPFLMRKSGMFHVLDVPVPRKKGVHLYGMIERQGLLKCCVQGTRHDVVRARSDAFDEVSVQEVEDAHAVLARVWPEARIHASPVHHKVGWNVETASGEFFYGASPVSPQIYHAQAFCGHGFKMFPALSEQLCDAMCCPE